MGKKCKVSIDYVHPAIPIRIYDYHAWVVGDEEGKSGDGATIEAALSSLADAMDVDVEYFEIVGPYARREKHS